MKPIDPDLLTRTAFGLLVTELAGYGNTLSDMHRAALMELVDTFTGYSVGTLEGRRAFPLPAGMGKTLALQCFLVALNRLGYVVPVSVAASKVAALSNLKRALLAQGVPEYLIGLKHSMHELTQDNLLPSTGSESRLFQLVSHARVRGGSDFELFGMHEGTARALMVYDETFLRSDSSAFSARAFYSAVAVLEIEAEGNRSPLLVQLVAYLKGASTRIRAALTALLAVGDPNCQGAQVELPSLGAVTIEAFRETVARHSGSLRGFAPELDALLQQSQDVLRAIGSEQGDGVVTARDAVPAALRNVVILDASAPIRELARLDPSVLVVESFAIADLKSFEHVEINQFVSPGGRSSIGHSLRADRKEASAVALEVASIIRAGWETERAFLVFTFVKRGGLDMAEELKRDLQRTGIDTDAKTEDGSPRINWLTYGSETSLNGLEFCTSVIMAGVLHRSHLDLAAVVRGQTGNPAEPTPSSRIRELIESEIAHCLMQGASRGSCRRIEAGRAQPMRLWFIHKNPAIRLVLDRVMPGAVWTFPEPKHLRKAAADSKAAHLLGQLLAHLTGLSVDRLSTQAAKKALVVPKTTADAKAWTRCIDLLDPREHGWQLDKQSLVRVSSTYGFTPQC